MSLLESPGRRVAATEAALTRFIEFFERAEAEAQWRGDRVHPPVRAGVRPGKGRGRSVRSWWRIQPVRRQGPPEHARPGGRADTNTQPVDWRKRPKPAALRFFRKLKAGLADRQRDLSICRTRLAHLRRTLEVPETAGASICRRPVSDSRAAPAGRRRGGRVGCQAVRRDGQAGGDRPARPGAAGAGAGVARRPVRGVSEGGRLHPGIGRSADRPDECIPKHSPARDRRGRVCRPAAAEWGQAAARKPSTVQSRLCTGTADHEHCYLLVPDYGRRAEGSRRGGAPVLRRIAVSRPRGRMKSRSAAKSGSGPPMFARPCSTAASRTSNGQTALPPLRMPGSTSSNGCRSMCELTCLPAHSAVGSRVTC